MDSNHHIIMEMDNDEARLLLSRIMSRLQGKATPDDKLDRQLSALAIGIDAINFVDGEIGFERES